jgi:hypothetical protein
VYLSFIVLIVSFKSVLIFFQFALSYLMILLGVSLTLFSHVSSSM